MAVIRNILTRINEYTPAGFVIPITDSENPATTRDLGKIGILSYLVACFPRHVMNDFGETEELMLSCAKMFSRIFDSIVGLLSNGVNSNLDTIHYSLTQAVKVSYVQYETSFISWETEDRARLDKRMYHGLHVLHAARTVALTRVPPDVENIPILDTQIQRVSIKLRQISGRV